MGLVLFSNHFNFFDTINLFETLYLTSHSISFLGSVGPMGECAWVVRPVVSFGGVGAIDDMCCRTLEEG